MGRDVPFNDNAKCDIYGEMGAYDIMGDLCCIKCLDRFEKVDKIKKQKYAPLPKLLPVEKLDSILGEFYEEHGE